MLLIGVLFLVIRLQGYVRGQEFAPSHFQQRDFTFFEIPLVHIQITPIRRKASTPNTANYLRLNSLVTTAPGAPTTWHLVTLRRGITSPTPADAELLLSQLSLENGGTEYWRQWSIDHPKQAKVFWPVIQRLADRELYVLMPPLFEMAQATEDPTELQTRIDQRLKVDLADLIGDLRGSDRDDLADAILAEALNDYPDDPSLSRLKDGEE